MYKRILFLFSISFLSVTVLAQEKKKPLKEEEQTFQLMKVEKKSQDKKSQREIIPKVSLPKKPSLSPLSYSDENNTYAEINKVKNNLSEIRELDYRISKTSDVSSVSDFDKERVEKIDAVLAIDEKLYKSLDMESKKSILELAKERGDGSINKFYPWFKETFNK